MSTISVQVSVYPLRQAELGPATSSALDAFRAEGLDVRTGAMSTVVVGDVDAVFDALKAAFESASAIGDVDMLTSISNCCPTEATSR